MKKNSFVIILLIVLAVIMLNPIKKIGSGAAVSVAECNGNQECIDCVTQFPSCWLSTAYGTKWYLRPYMWDAIGCSLSTVGGEILCPTTCDSSSVPNKCTGAPGSCTDTDSSDYYTQGVVTYVDAQAASHTYVDTCVNSLILAEQSCYSGQRQEEATDCSTLGTCGQCSNGACTSNCNECTSGACCDLAYSKFRNPPCSTFTSKLVCNQYSFVCSWDSSASECSTLPGKIEPDGALPCDTLDCSELGGPCATYSGGVINIYCDGTSEDCDATSNKCIGTYAAAGTNCGTNKICDGKGVCVTKPITPVCDAAQLCCNGGNAFYPNTYQCSTKACGDLTTAAKGCKIYADTPVYCSGGTAACDTTNAICDSNLATNKQAGTPCDPVTQGMECNGQGACVAINCDLLLNTAIQKAQAWVNNPIDATLNTAIIAAQAWVTKC